MPPDDPDSNQLLGRQALLERVGAANAVYPMRCDEGPEPYQLRLGEIGKLDVIHLGLGPDGHTASLFPDSAALDADPGQLVDPATRIPTGRNPHRAHDPDLRRDRPGPPGRLHRGRRGQAATPCRPSSTAPTSRRPGHRRPGHLAGRPRRRPQGFSLALRPARRFDCLGPRQVRVIVREKRRGRPIATTPLLPARLLLRCDLRTREPSTFLMGKRSLVSD